MRRSRRVAIFARRSGFGQPQATADSYRDSAEGYGNPQESLLGQPDQPNRPDSDQLIYEKHESSVREHDATTPACTGNRVSHVRVQNEPDQADQADRAMESAAFGNMAQLSQSLTKLSSLTDHDEAESVTWLKGDSCERTAEPAPFIDAAHAAMHRDLAVVVQDLTAEGKLIGAIRHLFGLTAYEVRAMLR